jgi:hypothetical protein
MHYCRSQRTVELTTAAHQFVIFIDDVSNN